MDLKINYQDSIPRIQDLENRKNYFNSTHLDQNNCFEMKIEENLQKQTNYNLAKEKDELKKISIKGNSDLSLNIQKKSYNQINLNSVETQGDISLSKTGLKEHFVNQLMLNNKNKEDVIFPSKDITETTKEIVLKPLENLQKSPIQTSLLNESLMFQDDFYREEEIQLERFHNHTSTTQNNEEVDSNNDDDTDTATEDKECTSYEQEQAFRILHELMSESHKNINWPFLHAVDANMEGCQDYYERIKRPMWLYKMQDKLQKGNYEDLGDMVGDVRLIVSNCHLFNGPSHPISKKASKLETLIFQKVNLLPREIKDKVCLRLPLKKLPLSNNTTFTSTQQEHKVSLKGRSAARERMKYFRQLQITERRMVMDRFVETLSEWDDDLFKNISYKAMWELPQIGLFLFLCSTPLNLDLSQYELERCLVLSKQTTAMQRLMTSLLSTTTQRNKLHLGEMMPSRVWQDKLKDLLDHWYKILYDHYYDLESTSDKLAIDPLFFKVLGLKNPLCQITFHDLTYYQRVWVVKSICNHILESQKSLLECMERQDIIDMRAHQLGVDLEGNHYYYFSQFCGDDVRIYRQAPLPTLEVRVPDLSQYQEPVKKSKKNTKKMKLKKSKKFIDGVLNSAYLQGLKRNKAATTTPKNCKKASINVYTSGASEPPRSRDSRLRQNPRRLKNYKTEDSESSSSNDDDEEDEDDKEGKEDEDNASESTDKGNKVSQKTVIKSKVLTSEAYNGKCDDVGHDDNNEEEEQEEREEEQEYDDDDEDVRMASSSASSVSSSFTKSNSKKKKGPVKKVKKSVTKNKLLVVMDDNVGELSADDALHPRRSLRKIIEESKKDATPVKRKGKKGVVGSVEKKRRRSKGERKYDDGITGDGSVLCDVYMLERRLRNSKTVTSYVSREGGSGGKGSGKKSRKSLKREKKYDSVNEEINEKSGGDEDKDNDDNDVDYDDTRLDSDKDNKVGRDDKQKEVIDDGSVNEAYDGDNNETKSTQYKSIKKNFDEDDEDNDVDNEDEDNDDGNNKIKVNEKCCRKMKEMEGDDVKQEAKEEYDLKVKVQLDAAVCDNKNVGDGDGDDVNMKKCKREKKEDGVNHKEDSIDYGDKPDDDVKAEGDKVSGGDGVDDSMVVDVKEEVEEKVTEKEETFSYEATILGPDESSFCLVVDSVETLEALIKELRPSYLEGYVGVKKRTSATRSTSANKDHIGVNNRARRSRDYDGDNEDGEVGSNADDGDKSYDGGSVGDDGSDVGSSHDPKKEDKGHDNGSIVDGVSDNNDEEERNEDVCRNDSEVGEEDLGDEEGKIEDKSEISDEEESDDVKELKEKARKWLCTPQGRLHSNLSKLLSDLQPHEGKLLQMLKKKRMLMRREHDSYVEPREIPPEEKFPNETDSFQADSQTSDPDYDPNGGNIEEEEAHRHISLETIARIKAIEKKKGGLKPNANNSDKEGSIDASVSEVDLNVALLLSEGRVLRKRQIPQHYHSPQNSPVKKSRCSLSRACQPKNFNLLFENTDNVIAEYEGKTPRQTNLDAPSSSSISFEPSESATSQQPFSFLSSPQLMNPQQQLLHFQQLQDNQQQSSLQTTQNPQQRLQNQLMLQCQQSRKLRMEQEFQQQQGLQQQKIQQQIQQPPQQQTQQKPLQQQMIALQIPSMDGKIQYIQLNANENILKMITQQQQNQHHTQQQYQQQQPILLNQRKQFNIQSNLNNNLPSNLNQQNILVMNNLLTPSTISSPSNIAVTSLSSHQHPNPILINNPSSNNIKLFISPSSNNLPSQQGIRAGNPVRDARASVHATDTIRNLLSLNKQENHINPSTFNLINKSFSTSTTTLTTTTPSAAMDVHTKTSMFRIPGNQLDQTSSSNHVGMMSVDAVNSNGNKICFSNNNVTNASLSSMHIIKPAYNLAKTNALSLASLPRFQQQNTINIQSLMMNNTSNNNVANKSNLSIQQLLASLERNPTSSGNQQVPLQQKQQVQQLQQLHKSPIKQQIPQLKLLQVPNNATTQSKIPINFNSLIQLSNQPKSMQQIQHLLGSKSLSSVSFNQNLSSKVLINSKNNTQKVLLNVMPSQTPLITPHSHLPNNIIKLQTNSPIKAPSIINIQQQRSNIGLQQTNFNSVNLHPQQHNTTLVANKVNLKRPFTIVPTANNHPKIPTKILLQQHISMNQQQNNQQLQQQKHSSQHQTVQQQQTQQQSTQHHNISNLQGNSSTQPFNLYSFLKATNNSVASNNNNVLTTTNNTNAYFNNIILNTDNSNSNDYTGSSNAEVSTDQTNITSSN